MIAGDIKIKLCDIELLRIQIRLLVARSTRRRDGVHLVVAARSAGAPAATLPAANTRHSPSMAPHTPSEHYQFRDLEKWKVRKNGISDLVTVSWYYCPTPFDLPLGTLPWPLNTRTTKSLNADAPECRSQIPEWRYPATTQLERYSMTEKRNTPWPERTGQFRPSDHTRNVDSIGGSRRLRNDIVDKLVDWPGTAKPSRAAASCRASIRREAPRRLWHLHPYALGRPGRARIEDRALRKHPPRALGETVFETSASRWSTCTKRRTTCWCWRKSRA